MEGTIEELSPKRTKTCMNVPNFVKGTSFLENPRRVPIVCYIFLRILPLSFLLAKKKKNKIMKVHYAGHVSRISTGEMEAYVGQICSMRSQENSFSSQAVNAV